jgi:hypothetical protein
MASHTVRPRIKFPRAEVAKALGHWWDDRLESALSRRRTPEECRRLGGTVFDIQPEMSSTQAVPVLLDLAEILGYEPDKKVIRRGGYRSRDEFLSHMCEQLECDYTEQHRSGKPAISLSNKGVKIHA